MNWKVWSAALAAVAAVILVIRLTRPSTGDGASEVRGTQIVLTPPAAAARPLRFHWTSGIVAPQFAFRIADSAGAEIFHTRTDVTNVTVPADGSSRLQAGQTYTWTVTALDTDDKPITTATSTFVAAAPRR